MNPNDKPTRELGDLSDVARPLTVDGTTYMLAPLQVGDIAARQAIIKSMRKSAMLDTLRRTPLAEGIVSGALSNVEVSSVTVMDVFDDMESRIALTSLAVKRGGGDMPDLMQLKPGTFTRLWQGVIWISGLAVTEGDDAATDPFDGTIGMPKK